MAISAHSTPASAIPLMPNSLRPGGCPPGVEPHVWREGLSARVEQHLAIVTGLLAMLDDGVNPELEPDADDEPSIGGNAPWGQEVDLELDTVDSEPSLGWGSGLNQALIATENTFDSDLESDELERGEGDDAEADGNERIEGSGYRL